LTQEGLPLPVPSPDTREYWEKARAHELVLQRCAKCGRYTHPPRPVCGGCGSEALEWVRSQGKGRVYSFVITCQPVHPALAGKTPWAVVEVELEEGVHLYGNVVDCPAESIRIDMPVRVVFRDVTAEVTLPQFSVDFAQNT